MKVRSPDGDTEYFDIVAGELQGDTLAPYLFIVCLGYVLRTPIDKIRENGIELTKKRSKRYPAKTITDADYADGIAILANTPNQAETLLHSLERAAAGIGLHVNVHKTDCICAIIKQATSPHRDELISDVLLWTPTYGRAKAGRPAQTYIQQLCQDTGCSPEDLPEAMNDREKWQERVRDICACVTT